MIIISNDLCDIKNISECNPERPEQKQAAENDVQRSVFKFQLVEKRHTNDQYQD